MNVYDAKPIGNACKSKINTFQIGLILLLFLWGLFSISTILLVLGISVSKLNFFLSIVLVWLTIKNLLKIQITLETWIASGLILTISILYAANIIDGSWDGNTYHKTITGVLALGWNPLYCKFDDFANATGLFSTILWERWYDAYPIASEIVAATLYSITGNIEAGKAFTIISCVSGVLICASYVREVFHIEKWWIRFLIVALLFFNPISIAQIQTFYNDALLWSICFIVFFSLIKLTLSKNNTNNLESWTIIFCCITLGVNIKFSGTIFNFIICATFFIWWMIKCFHGDDNFQLVRIKKIIYFFIFTCIASVLILGCTSYAKNVIVHGNPLYPAVGHNKVELVNEQVPNSISNMSNLERFVASFLSQTSDDRGNPSVVLKVPFSVKTSEINVDYVQTRLAGWGVFFSGAFLLSLMFAVFFIIRERRNKYAQLIIATLFISLAPIAFIPGLFWARYWMILYIVPVLMLACCYSIGAKKIASIICLTLIINMVIPSIQSFKVMMISQKSIAEYIKLADTSRHQVVSIRLQPPNSSRKFEGLVFNLKDSGIENYKFSERLDFSKTISWKYGKIWYEQ